MAAIARSTLAAPGRSLVSTAPNRKRAPTDVHTRCKLAYTVYRQPAIALVLGTTNILSRHAIHRSPLSCTAAVVTGAAAAPIATSFATKFLAIIVGYCVLLGSCFRSVPQIVKVWSNRSVIGLSPTSNIVELLCYTIVVAYNVKQGYAFNTFGEVLACWLQDIVLVALIMAYQGAGSATKCAAAAAFSGLCCWLFSGGCSKELLATLQLATIIIMPLFARLPQIVLNIRRGDSGMLSATTCLLSFSGNMARIFTTLVLTGDRLMLASSVTQGVLNGILLYQSLSTVLRGRRGTAVLEEQAAGGEEFGGEGREEGEGEGPQPLPAAA